MWKELLLLVFFFFQAEDGIRGAQESRGLGDVYKRQGEDETLFREKLGEFHFAAVEGPTVPAQSFFLLLRPDGDGGSVPPQRNQNPRFLECLPVSYTHLTLPTIYSV